MATAFILFTWVIIAPLLQLKDPWLNQQQAILIYGLMPWVQNDLNYFLIAGILALLFLVTLISVSDNRHSLILSIFGIAALWRAVTFCSMLGEKGNGNFTYFSRASFGGRIYNLARFDWSHNIGDDTLARYYLFECDLLGISCASIKTFEGDVSSAGTDFEATLELSPSEDTYIVYINNQIVAEIEA